MYVPGVSPVIDEVVPVPVNVVPPGDLVRVHNPVDGKPVKTTLPVAIVQDGCVIAPAAGAAGNGITVAVTDTRAAETQPSGLVASA